MRITNDRSQMTDHKAQGTNVDGSRETRTMSFMNSINNKVSGAFDSQRLSHAYIAEGAMVETLAMAVVCDTRDGTRPCMSCAHCDKASRHVHPDITVVGKLDDKLIVGVDQIRELKKDVYVVPNDAMQKAYVVNDADSMNANAQNAFLQILEEPPAHAVFILCTGNPAALLPTVRSRCVELKTQSVSEPVTGLAEEPVAESAEDRAEIEEIANDLIIALVGGNASPKGGNVKLMECMFRLDKLDRYAFSVFLALARAKVVIQLREQLEADAPAVCKALVHAESVLVNAGEMLDLNVSAGHISGFICASLVDL